MARNLVLGLAGILLLLAVFAVLVSQMVVRPARAMVQGLAEIAKLDQQVLSTREYLAASDTLRSDDFYRVLRVHRQVKQGLGARFAGIEPRLRQLTQQSIGQLQLDYRKALDLFRDQGRLLVEAKKIQVEALNQQNLSVAQYRALHKQIYSSLHLGVPELNAQELLRQVARGEFNPVVSLPQSPVAAENRRLVEPFTQELLLYYPLTWFGL